MNRRAILLVMFFILFATGCEESKEASSDGPKKIFRLDAPPTLVSLSNQDQWTLEGSCNFTGEATLRFGQESSESTDYQVRCIDGAWSLDELPSWEDFADGEIVLQILYNGAELISALTIQKDTTRPAFDESSTTGSLVIPAPGQITLNGTCDDDGEVTLTLLGDFDQVPSKASCIAGAWQKEIDLSQLGHGDYYFDLSFQDNAGNMAAQQLTLKVIRDTEKPVLTIDDLAEQPVTSSNMNAYPIAGDCEAVLALLLRLDGVDMPPPSCTMGRWTFSLQGADLAEGTHNVEVTVTDAAGNTNQASRTLLKDTLAPMLEGDLAVPPPPSTGTTYDSGVQLSFSLVFNEEVEVTGTPRIPLTLTPTSGVATDVFADYAPEASSTHSLAFIYVVNQSHVGKLGVKGTLNLNGGSITDTVGNGISDSLALSVPSTFGTAGNEVQVNGQSVTITTVAVSQQGAYKEGATGVVLTATFSSAVDIDPTGGVPQLILDVDGVQQFANYSGSVAASNQTTLTFNYTVGAGDDLQVTATGINLNSGTITVHGDAGPQVCVPLTWRSLSRAW